MTGGIIRAPRPTRYEIVPAATIEDSRISYRAMGVLVRLLRLPDGASIAADELSKGAGREGRTAIQTAIRKLRTVGYIRQVKRQNAQGHWITERWVYDTPCSDATGDQKPVAGKPAIGKPVAKSSKSTTSSNTVAARRGAPAALHRRQHGDQELIAGIETWTEADRALAKTLVEAHGEAAVKAAALAVVVRGQRPLPSRVASELSNAVEAKKQDASSQASPLRKLQDRRQRLAKSDPKRIDDAFHAACDAVKKKL
jgi:hypothetical protein